MRVFVAAWPPAAVCDRLLRLPRHHEPGVRHVVPDNWHITLRFIGDVDPFTVAERLASTVLPRVTARLGPVVERLDGRQIVLPAVGVDPLAAAVRAATDDLGDRDRRPFRGHLTIARTRSRATSALVGTPIDAEFLIAEVAVVTSELRPTGAVYTTVANLATVATGSRDPTRE